MTKSFLYFICCVSAMGGLLFGYDWVVIGGAKPFYENFFGIADLPVMQGIAMTTALLGCLVGAMVAGAAADRYGRRPLLTASAVLFTLSAIGTGLFNDFTLFNVARFVGGIGIGVASTLSPMYIAEVSPAHIRGRLVSINQMTIVLGILAAQVVNMLIGQGVTMEWGTAMGWRWMFWAETVPAAIFLVMSFFIPESPVFLALKGSGGKGKVAQTGVDNNNETPGLSAILSSGAGRILVLGVIIAVFQQWCGTNVIFNYAEEIFTSAGYDVDGMFINIVITGIANVLFTLVALYTVERWGRRTLMLIGAGTLFLIYLTLGICYYTEVSGIAMVVLVVLAISCYAMTLGPITWVLLSEIFPHRIRGLAMAICTFSLWVGCSTLTFSFPIINDALGSYGTFWIYSTICLLAFLYLYRYLPETKGRTLEELEEMLTKRD